MRPLADTVTCGYTGTPVGRQNGSQRFVNELAAMIWRLIRVQLSLTTPDQGDHFRTFVGGTAGKGSDSGRQPTRLEIRHRLYFLGPSTLLSTIFRASLKASAGVASGAVAGEP